MGLNNLPKSPTAMAWVTAADVTGSNTTLVDSGWITLPLPPVWWSEMQVQIEYVQQRTGGTGNCLTHARIETVQPLVTASDDAVGVPYFFPQMTAANVAKTRRQSIRFNSAYSSNGEAGDNLSMRVRTKGSAADTEFSVTGIKARIVYTPL